MTDLELMQDLKARFGATIDAACSVSSVPAAFLAALVANESGGNINAKRFEKNVLAALWEVLLGRKEAYGSIPRLRLVSYVTGAGISPVNAPANLPADAFQRVDALASSWGLTQIMGYHALEFDVALAELQSPEGNLAIAVKMLSGFAREFTLNLASDFSALLHCWNAGSPNAPTFDPQYVPNALRRMDLYAGLA